MSGKSPIVLRGVLAGDMPALARLTGELGYPSTADQIRRRLERVASDPDHFIFVAAKADGEAIGWVHVQLTKMLEDEPRGEILGLVVATETRGTGVGRSLLEAAEVWTREHGGTVVSLRSNIVRKDAHRFYERLGYTVTKTSLNFRKHF